MKRHHRAFAAAAIAGLLLAVHARPSPGATVYGVTLFDNQLITIDTGTGTGTLVGSLSTSELPYGLAMIGNNLYTFDSAADVIRQLNPATGATQATFPIGIPPVLGQGGLAFQTSTVGFLTTALNPTTFNVANDLYRFNISTGTTTLVGTTSDTLEAIAFSGGGTLYGLGKNDGNLYTVNPATAALTLVGNVGVSIGSPTGGLTFGPTGVLYATLDDSLYTLNPTTGLATEVGSSIPGVTSLTGFNSISGLAFAAAVPEPSSIVVLGVGIGAVCLYAARRFNPMSRATA